MGKEKSLRKEIKYTNLLLEQIRQELKNINFNMERHYRETRHLPPANYDDIPAWMKLPTHVKKTLLALIKLGGSGTSSDVAKITGRARAVESGRFNQLLLNPEIKLRRHREGRKVIWTLEEPY